MATINLGAIKFNWKGAYNNGTTYAVDDVVSSSGNSYVCIQASTGNAVGNATAYWNIMSSAGTNGTDGTDGTSVDVSKLTNDISTLAIRQATQENLVGYNTNSMSVDVFQDSSKIASLSNVARTTDEYVASVYVGTSPRFATPTKNGNATFQTSVKKFGNGALYNAAQTDWLQTPSLSGVTGIPTTGDWTIDFWAKYSARAGADRIIGVGSGSTDNNANNHFSFGYNSASSMNFFMNGSNYNHSNYTGYNTDWHHYLIQGNSSNLYHFEDGVYKGTNNNASNGLFQQSGTFIQMGGRSGSAAEKFQGYIDEFRLSNIHRVNNSASGNFTPPTAQYTTDANTMVLMHMDDTNLADSSLTATVNNATGNFQSTGVTVKKTKKVGAIISYQDNAGTNALNTDIVLQLSADGGSNFTTATLTALPNISSTVKMAKVNDLTVTAGTSLKYKILLANQSSGSKEARVHGVSLMY